MTTLASDTFTRANVSGSFGTSSDGNTYTYGSTSAVSTTNLTGNEGTAAGGNDLYALIGTGTTATINILVRCATDSNGVSIGVTAREAGGAAVGNNYRCYLLGQTFYIDKDISGSYTTITSTGFSYSANQYCWIRFICSGTSLTASVWLDGNSEPGSPTLSGTDSAISAAGRYGVFFSSGGGTGYYDHLTVTDNGGSGGGPAPSSLMMMMGVG